MKILAWKRKLSPEQIIELQLKILNLQAKNGGTLSGDVADKIRLQYGLNAADLQQFRQAMTTIPKIQRPSIICEFCDYEWTPRKANLFKCPKCKRVRERKKVTTKSIDTVCQRMIN